MRSFAVTATCAVALMLAAAGVAAPGPTVADAPSPTADRPAVPAPAAEAVPGLTAPDLEAWLDGFLPYALERGDIAGAVIVVVKNGQVLLQKGYGYADVAQRTPVDPARTLFRPGSTSKLFTWTAVMQQVERGRIDLDTDINTYLDFEVPPGPGGRPITLRDVMTHTTGFEEALKDLIITDPQALPSLGDVIKRWTPQRIFPAGSTPAYSNYATALAGYIVERTSGLGFDEYIERNIFGPLQMNHSSFRGPLPPTLQPAVSQGYELGSGEPQAYELVALAPAGSLASTGADMAAFMIAHLQDGAYGSARILSATTARTMHTTGRTQLPPLNRMMLGFYESNTNGRRVISHGGDTQFFHSDLHLFLDDGVGYFVSFNSLGKDGAAGKIRTALFRAFSDRYLPGPAPQGQVDPQVAAEHARLIAGRYASSRRSESSLLSLVGLFSEVQVTGNADGTITSPQLTGPNGLPMKWREIAPFVWVEVGGKTRLAAQVVDGRVTRFSIDDLPFMVMEPAPAARTAAWLLPAAGASMVALLLTLILWPVTALMRRRYARPSGLSAEESRARRLVRIGAAAAALPILAWGGTVVAMLSHLPLLSSRLDWWIVILHVVGTIGVFAGLALALWNLWVVWRGGRRWFARLWSAVLAVSTAVLAWLAVAFHLVGFGTNY